MKLLLLTLHSLLAISDHWVHKVRIIDMKNKNVWSLCSDELIKDFKEVGVCEVWETQHDGRTSCLRHLST